MLIRALGISAILAILLGLTGGQLALGQQILPPNQAPDLGEESVSQAFPAYPRLFEQIEAILWLRNRGIRAEGNIAFQLLRLDRIPLPADPGAPRVRASEFRLDRASNGVEAVGDVVMTTTAEDGTTLTFRSDRITIVE